jgi:hypothetical protein
MKLLAHGILSIEKLYFFFILSPSRGRERLRGIVSSFPLTLVLSRQGGFAPKVVLASKVVRLPQKLSRGQSDSIWNWLLYHSNCIMFLVWAVSYIERGIVFPESVMLQPYLGLVSL